MDGGELFQMSVADDISDLGPGECQMGTLGNEGASCAANKALDEMPLQLSDPFSNRTFMGGGCEGGLQTYRAWLLLCQWFLLVGARWWGSVVFRIAGDDHDVPAAKLAASGQAVASVNQVSPSWVVWGVAPLVVVEGQWESTP